MKNFKFFGIIALIGIMASCTKNIQEPSVADIKSGTAIPVQALGSSPCADVIKSVGFDGTMLVFNDGQQFTNVMHCLEQQVDDHGEAFDSQTDGMTDDQATTYAESIGFDEDQPLVNFENGLGFYSLRTKIAADLVQWLNNPVLDDNTDPDNHVIIDDVLRALLNPAGRVKVGSTVYDFTDLNSVNIPRPEGLFECWMFGKNRNRKNYDNGKKQLRVKTSLVGVPFAGFSSAKTKGVSYKFVNSKWKRHFTDLHLQLNGGARDFSCDGIATIGLAKSRKKRSKITGRFESFEVNNYSSHPYWTAKDDDFEGLIQSLSHPDAFLSVPIKMVW